MSSNDCLLQVQAAFPSDGERYTVPVRSVLPLTSADVLEEHRDCLSNFELTEILQYRSVYYFAPTVDKLATSANVSCNHGFDTDAGRYRCIQNDHIKYRYQILGELGQGTFGDVIEALDHKTGKRVAVKITRNDSRLFKQAQAEVKLLEFLQSKASSSQSNVVNILDRFVFRNHVCVVFELLEEDLFSALKNMDFQGFELHEIRTIATDVLDCLDFLSKVSVVHCDLKPENLVFRDTISNHVKVIDFGSSCFGKALFDGNVQSLYYRAPEVILEAGFNTPIDMWSLGCIVAELLTGVPLFPGRTPQEQLLLQMEILGLPSSTLLSRSMAKLTYFDKQGQPLSLLDRKGRTRKPASFSLKSAVGINASKEFLNFIERCLCWDPTTRMTPAEALSHPFITGLRSSLSKSSSSTSCSSDNLESTVPLASPLADITVHLNNRLSPSAVSCSSNSSVEII